MTKVVELWDGIGKYRVIIDDQGGRIMGWYR